MPNADRLLRELLAIIHRDGGQHVDQVGLDQATSEAIEIVLGLFSNAKPVSDPEIGH